ncbi:MAG: choice-of-anchor D domain-containing protein [Candidatus Cloacimonetes bacterium]|nr:choice-of-anchor D domain-containing protein [Candidatus Cloacimonadota bacterium]
MKITIWVVVFLLITTMLCAVNVVIGGSGICNGPDESPCPYGNFYRNERVQCIIEAAEIHAAGGGAGPINSVSLNVFQLNDVGPLSNYRVKIGTTDQAVYSNNDFIQDLTEVWWAASFQPSLGENVHYFNQPFVWDGVSNIVLDMGYSLTSYYAPETANPGVEWGSTGALRTAYIMSDATDAGETLIAYQRSVYRSKITFNMGAQNPTVPNSVIPSFPGNGATHIPVPSTISWISGGGNPEGYKLYLGTVDPPPFIADVEQDSTYTDTLAYDTTYYWQIVPYNSFGDAVDCPVWSFSTRTDPVISSFPWQNDFGSGTSISFPLPDWSFYYGVLSDSTSLGNPGTGYWYLGNWLNQGPTNRAPTLPIQTTNTGWMITPWLNLPTANYDLSFDLAMVARFTSQPPQTTGWDDVFAVLVSNDETWNTSRILRKWDNTGSEYVLNSLGNQGINITIPIDSQGMTRIAFYGGSQFSNASNQIFVDNIEVRLNPGLPILTVNPGSMDFDIGMQHNFSQIIELSVSNSGQDTLRVDLDDITIIGENPECFSIISSGLPFVLTSGQTAVLPVQFNPSSEGAKSAILRIVNNQCRQNYDIPLNGYALSNPSVAVGIGSETSNYLPIEANRGFSYSQSIILQSEINVPFRQIKQLWFYWNSMYEGFSSNEWCIYMGHTAKTVFENGDDWVQSDGLIKVFDGRVDLPAEPGWICVPLDTPFIYDNISNLVIATEENESLYSGFTSGFRGTSVGSSRSMAYGASDFNPGPDDLYTGVLYNFIPNTILCFEDASTTPILQVSETEIDFYSQESGIADGPLKIVHIRNVGGGTLIFDSNQMTIQGPEADHFVLYGDGSCQLQTGQRASFLLRFSPLSPGEKNAYLLIPGNAIPDTLRLTGMSYPAGSFYENFEGTLFPPEGWERSDLQWTQFESCQYPELIPAGTYCALSSMNRDHPVSHLITPAINLETGAKTLSYLARGFNNNHCYGASTLKLSYMSINDSEWVDLPDSVWFFYDETERIVVHDISFLGASSYRFRFSVISNFWWSTEALSSVMLDDIRCTGCLGSVFLETDRTDAYLSSDSSSSVQIQLTTWNDWTAICSEPWLHISSTSGNSSTSLSIFADQNPGLSSRSATITFSNGITPDRICNVVQSGLRGNALSFDGVDDYVVTQQSVVSINDAFSISTWVKWQPSSPNEIDFICANLYEQMEIHTGATNNNLRFIPTTGVYLDAGPVLATDTWTHIACSYSINPAEAHIWVNGVEQTIVNNGPNPIGTAFSQTPGSLYLGRRASNMFYFNGNMDDFSLWNIALTSSQVNSLLHAPPDLVNSGLLLYYNFNHGVPNADNPSVSQLVDYKSGMDGTLHNFTLSGETSNWVNSGAMVPALLSAPVLSFSPNAILNWDTVPGADCYKIYRASTSDGTYEHIATTYENSWQVDSSLLDRAFFKIIAVSEPARK